MGDLSSPETAQPVLVDFKSLSSGADLSKQIEAAYGYDGLGILAVHGIPDVGALREALFKDGYRFSGFEEKIKAKYEHKESFYGFGWSHGKEILQGHPDWSKGSYYNNPVYNKPYQDSEIATKYPAFAHPNVWPTEELPSLERNFMNMGQLVVKVGLMIAKQCDKYVESKSKTYKKGRLFNMLSSNRACKARLLHYYPVSAGGKEAEQSAKKGADPFSSWCGWHNDHSSLTGLVLGQFVDTKTGNFIKNPDPSSGLHIRSRKGKLIKISLPANDTSVHAGNTLLFQIGETAQIHSGGVLQATPHAVRGAQVPDVSRESFAVFMQPSFEESMDVPQGVDPSCAQSSDAASQLPKGVPTLKSRYGTKGCPFTACNFAQFTAESLKAYH